MPQLRGRDCALSVPCVRLEVKAVSSPSIKAVPRAAIVALLPGLDPRLHTDPVWAADSLKSGPQLTVVLTQQESASALDLTLFQSGLLVAPALRTILHPIQALGHLVVF